MPKQFQITIVIKWIVLTFSSIEYLGERQCDQIWRNSATLAKVYKPLANFWKTYLTLPSIWNILGHILMKLGKFLQMAKFWKLSQVIWSHWTYAVSMVQWHQLVWNNILALTAKAHSEYLSSVSEKSSLETLLPDGTPSMHHEIAGSPKFTGVNLGDRTKHLRVHTREKPFHCPECFIIK